MRFKILNLLLFFVLFLSNLNAQERAPIESIVVFLPQGFILESLTSYGMVNTTISNADNIANSNPASLAQFQKISLGISKQFDSSIDNAWIADIGHKRISTIRPQSIGVVIPFRNFRFGFGMSESYSTSLQIGDIQKTTEQFPDGTGSVFKPTHKTRVNKKSAIGAYSKQAVLRKKDQISIGGQYNFNSMNHDAALSSSSNDGPTFDLKTNSSSWSAGVKYSMYEVGVEQIHFGVFFEKSVKFSEAATINDSLSADPRGIPVVFAPQEFVGKLPAKLNFGLQINPSNKVLFFANVSKIFWGSIDESYQDQLDLAVSFVYYPGKTISTSVGVYKTDRKYTGDITTFFNVNKFDALFFTGGLTLQSRHFIFDIALADSRLFSSGPRKQTIIKVGLSTHLK